MSADGLIVHSLAEASLYLMLARCPACAGALVPSTTPARPEQDKRLDVPVICRDCGHVGSVRFNLDRVDPAEAAAGWEAWAAKAQAGQAPPINASGRPSRVLDLADWLTLHGMLSANARAKAEQARSSADRLMTRQMQIQASDCLEEAQKFFDADNDLPPEDAFFTDEGRRQFREHPELFLRARIASLRAASTVRTQRTDQE
jgi:hypothetical protein